MNNDIECKLKGEAFILMEGAFIVYWRKFCFRWRQKSPLEMRSVLFLHILCDKLGFACFLTIEAAKNVVPSKNFGLSLPVNNKSSLSWGGFYCIISKKCLCYNCEWFWYDDMTYRFKVIQKIWLLCCSLPNEIIRAALNRAFTVIQKQPRHQRRWGLGKDSICLRTDDERLLSSFCFGGWRLKVTEEVRLWPPTCFLWYHRAVFYKQRRNKQSRYWNLVYSIFKGFTSFLIIYLFNVNDN